MRSARGPRGTRSGGAAIQVGTERRAVVVAGTVAFVAGEDPGSDENGYPGACVARFVAMLAGSRWDRTGTHPACSSAAHYNPPRERARAVQETRESRAGTALTPRARAMICLGNSLGGTTVRAQFTATKAGGSWIDSMLLERADRTYERGRALRARQGRGGRIFGLGELTEWNGPTLRSDVRSIRWRSDCLANPGVAAAHRLSAVDRFRASKGAALGAVESPGSCPGDSLEPAGENRQKGRPAMEGLESRIRGVQ